MVAVTEPTGNMVVDELAADIQAAIIRYADYCIECSCEGPDSSCWYHLSKAEQRRLVLQYVVESVSP